VKLAIKFDGMKKSVMPKHRHNGFFISNDYFSLKRTTSRAIINSSSVGINNAFTFESSVEMILSTPRTLFFSSSISQPNHEIPSMMILRVGAEIFHRRRL